MDGVATRATAQGAGSVLVASLTFVLLTAIAMVEYPGGSKYAPRSHHYVFFKSFLSDLGATKTHAGLSNTSSWVLFTLAMTCLGISLIAFSDSWQGLAERRGAEVRVAWIYKWSAVGCGICCLGIGATPFNLLPVEHNVFVLGAFTLLVVLVLAMLAVQRRNHWPPRFVLSNAMFMIVLAVVRPHTCGRTERRQSGRPRAPGRRAEDHGVLLGAQLRIPGSWGPQSAHAGSTGASSGAPLNAASRAPAGCSPPALGSDGHGRFSGQRRLHCPTGLSKGRLLVRMGCAPAASYDGAAAGGLPTAVSRSTTVSKRLA